jgi:hypothetical protein
MVVHYLVDERRIAHQTVDGEVIAIDFVNGAYFSMRATAGEIWQMLASNVALDAVIALYQENSPLPAETLVTEIQAFVSELLAANLLRLNDAPGTVQPVLPAIVAQRKPYTPPQLEKFEDMADLIMLDPVHDVSDAGWPHIPKPDA